MKKSDEKIENILLELQVEKLHDELAFATFKRAKDDLTNRVGIPAEKVSALLEKFVEVQAIEARAFRIAEDIETRRRDAKGRSS